MAAKSGKTITPVEPTSPEEAFEADNAKPGEAAKIKAKQKESKSGKYGATKAPPYKPAAAKNENDTEQKSTKKDDVKKEIKSWIEIELVGEDEKPIPGEKYEITLPDGTVASGTLDGNGFARVEGFDAGECKVTFPQLDKDAWKKL